MQVTKLMINSYVQYLRKFGIERIKDYADLLLKKGGLSFIEKEYVRQLPEYYQEDCGRMKEFISIMTESSLWYTLYL